MDISNLKEKAPEISVGKEVLNNRFATERGLCDLGYKTNSDRPQYVTDKHTYLESGLSCTNWI